MLASLLRLVVMSDIAAYVLQDLLGLADLGPLSRRRKYWAREI